MERFGQADEGLERAEPEFINQGNEVADMAAAGSGGLVFEAEQLPEFEHFVIDDSKGKLTLEEVLKPSRLPRVEPRDALKY